MCDNLASWTRKDSSCQHLIFLQHGRGNGPGDCHPKIMVSISVLKMKDQANVRSIKVQTSRPEPRLSTP
jgi:hypothetical protein